MFYRFKVIIIGNIPLITSSVCNLYVNFIYIVNVLPKHNCQKKAKGEKKDSNYF